MMTGFTHLHSSLRYLVLLFILLALAEALLGVAQGKAYGKWSKMSALLALIFCHIQLTVGLFLWFWGEKGLNLLLNYSDVMKDSAARFFAVEHITGMLIAVSLVTVGYAKAKRQQSDNAKHRTTLLYYAIALFIIFITIPWPFLRGFGRWI